MHASEAKRCVLPGEADAAVLRKTIVSTDWRDERVWEWTDTSRSAVRYRVTRSLAAQVAAKRGGDVFLCTVHLAQDRGADGAWGGLYGHIMFTEAMQEKNVGK